MPIKKMFSQTNIGVLFIDVSNNATLAIITVKEYQYCDVDDINIDKAKICKRLL